MFSLGSISSGSAYWLRRYLDRDEGREAEEMSLEVIRGVVDCFSLYLMVICQYLAFAALILDILLLTRL